MTEFNVKLQHGANAKHAGNERYPMYQLGRYYIFDRWNLSLFVVVVTFYTFSYNFIFLVIVLLAITNT